jgi:hypothetical protein
MEKDEKSPPGISERERSEDKMSVALLELAKGAADTLLHFEGTAAENAARELVTEELRCIETLRRLASEISERS